MNCDARVNFDGWIRKVPGNVKTLVCKYRPTEWRSPVSGRALSDRLQRLIQGGLAKGLGSRERRDDPSYRPAVRRAEVSLFLEAGVEQDGGDGFGVLDCAALNHPQNLGQRKTAHADALVFFGMGGAHF